MLMEPQSRISSKALKAWRIHAIINSLFFIVVCGVGVTMSLIFEWANWIRVLIAFVAIGYTYVFIVVMPKLRWRTWRYEVRDTEIELQHGVIFTKRTLIPMIRVQHVDTKQGPIYKKYNLATVEISTAATIHEIPALDLVEAERLRLYIGKLTRVADEDV
ncbi:PH domain-containing protein [Neobacillus sp. LXY-4]|uniref:PH domain-containing protein n=1 Tax=Neobacillus sp. LXY-4 TaxID=3379826 RepID=UPI003EE03478